MGALERFLDRVLTGGNKAAKVAAFMALALYARAGQAQKTTQFIPLERASAQMTLINALSATGQTDLLQTVAGGSGINEFSEFLAEHDRALIAGYVSINRKESVNVARCFAQAAEAYETYAEACQRLGLEDQAKAAYKLAGHAYTEIARYAWPEHFRGEAAETTNRHAQSTYAYQSAKIAFEKAGSGSWAKHAHGKIVDSYVRLAKEHLNRRQDLLAGRALEDAAAIHSKINPQSEMATELLKSPAKVYDNVAHNKALGLAAVIDAFRNAARVYALAQEPDLAANALRSVAKACAAENQPGQAADAWVTYADAVLKRERAAPDPSATKYGWIADAYAAAADLYTALGLDAQADAAREQANAAYLTAANLYVRRAEHSRSPEIAEIAYKDAADALKKAGLHVQATAVLERITVAYQTAAARQASDGGRASEAGDHERAAYHYEEAAEYFRRAGLPDEGERVMVLMGRAQAEAYKPVRSADPVVRDAFNAQKPDETLNRLIINVIAEHESDLSAETGFKIGKHRIYFNLSSCPVTLVTFDVKQDVEWCLIRKNNEDPPSWDLMTVEAAENMIKFGTNHIVLGRPLRPGDLLRGQSAYDLLTDAEAKAEPRVDAGSVGAGAGARQAGPERLPAPVVPHVRPIAAPTNLFTSLISRVRQIFS
ncbi:hypothetical protein AB870_23780 (plasmid) [Pandoraea faecigallinarum]|uniref:Uncharacterized protein n=2 Tax=Pandoraea faecigallinarum TaxID=656179 RepID=A0A0H3WZT8_9BURK|nr:hypothetical protein AB870_23780 [Pandoraea faecigallinarum]